MGNIFESFLFHYYKTEWEDGWLCIKQCCPYFSTYTLCTDLWQNVLQTLAALLSTYQWQVQTAGRVAWAKYMQVGFCAIDLKELGRLVPFNILSKAKSLARAYVLCFWPQNILGWCLYSDLARTTFTSPEVFLFVLFCLFCFENWRCMFLYSPCENSFSDFFYFNVVLKLVNIL